MLYRIVSRSSLPLRFARRFLFGAALVTIGYVVALIAPVSVDSVAGLSFGSPAVARHAATMLPGGIRPEAREAAATGESQHGFDYFPDHYINQAREPAEPIATF